MRKGKQLPTSTIRRARCVPDVECDSSCPNDSWGCEREKGHAGDHLAWEDYESGVLYPNGRWTNPRRKK